jgi:ubiquinone/menaquinone biosynthesis C-methylase UbiE
VSGRLVIPGDYQHTALHHGPPLQRFWHRNKLALVDAALPLPAGAVVVDVGCGSGNLTAHVARTARLAIGVDESEGAVRFARSRAGSPGPEAYVRARGDALPLADASADAAICVEVVEHLTDPLPLLREIRRVLRPGGRLLVTTPNYGRGSLWPLLEWLADKSGQTANMAEAQHVRRFTPRSLRRLVEDAGLTVADQGTFYRWSPLLGLLDSPWAGTVAAREITARGEHGALIWCVAQPVAAVSSSR